MLQHRHHASPLVLILFGGRETLFHREDLPHMNVMVTKEFNITSHQFGLSHGGEQLPLLHAVHVAHFRRWQMEFATPAGYSSGRDEHNLYASMTKIGHLIHQGRHPCKIQCAVPTGQHIASNFNCDSRRAKQESIHHLIHFTGTYRIPLSATPAQRHKGLMPYHHGGQRHRLWCSIAWAQRYFRSCFRESWEA